MTKKRSIATVLLTILLLVPALSACEPTAPQTKPADAKVALSPEAEQYIKTLQYAVALENAKWAATVRYATLVHFYRLLRFFAAVQAAQRPPAPTTPAGSVWDSLARCESGGNWAINSGNGYYGGLQFALSSWRGVGGSGYPHHASREVQIEMGKRLQASQGWGAWPACSRKLGLR